MSGSSPCWQPASAITISQVLAVCKWQMNSILNLESFLKGQQTLRVSEHCRLTYHVMFGLCSWSNLSCWTLQNVNRHCSVNAIWRACVFVFASTQWGHGVSARWLCWAGLGQNVRVECFVPVQPCQERQDIINISAASSLKFHRRKLLHELPRSRHLSNCSFFNNHLRSVFTTIFMGDVSVIGKIK